MTGVYNGPIDRLVGERALLLADESQEVGVVLAQFDNRELPEAFGWHRFSRGYFDIDVDPEVAMTRFHPGEFLEDELKELKLTAREFSTKSGISADVVDDLLAGAIGVDHDIAIKLARYFETTPEYWLNLQSMYYDEETPRDP